MVPVMEFDARNLALSNGAAVSTWTDSGSGGRNATQATGARQPVYNSTGINGTASVTFDGARWMNAPQTSAATLSATGLYTIFAVIKPTLTSGFTSFFDNDTGTGAGRNFITRINWNSGSPLAESLVFNASAASVFTDSQPITTGTAHVISAVRDTSTVQVWVDGTSNGSTATTGSPQTSATTNDLTVGASEGVAFASFKFLGEIGYIAYYTGAMGTGTRQTIEATLKAAFGTP